MPGPPQVLPAEMSHLVRLTRLNLRHNALTAAGLPQQLRDLPDLTWCDLTANALAGLPVTRLPTGLRQLLCSLNPLVTIPMDLAQHLPDLRMLELHQVGRGALAKHVQRLRRRAPQLIIVS